MTLIARGEHLAKVQKELPELLVTDVVSMYRLISRSLEFCCRKILPCFWNQR